jgi:hypothetical protein
VNRARSPIFKGEAYEVHEGSDQKSLRNLRVLRAFRGESVSQNLLRQALRVIKKTRGIESR